MPYSLMLPDLGEGLTEGEIVRWLVRAGDLVQAEQPLVEVMTDKVTTELPSPIAGRVLRLHGKEGEVVPVHHVLVEIDPEGAVETGSASPESLVPTPCIALPAASLSREPGETGAESATAGIPRTTPAVRHLARELGVDLNCVPGTGPGGRILEADVRAHRSKALPAAGESRPGDSAYERKPLRGVRRAIAEHLLESHRNTAPYTLVEEVDFTELVGVRERIQPLAEKAGTRITYLPFIIAALSMALREHPRFNACVEGEGGDLLVYRDQHVAIAIHTEDGLVVPVIRNVERRNLLDLAREVERLRHAARAGGLTREDMSGGTISVTSLGSVGGLLGTPMLNTPQIAVLGIHKIAARPVVREGAIVARHMANLSLTLDHRYIDGYEGARFAQTVRAFLEDPAVMLFSLSELRGGG